MPWRGTVAAAAAALLAAAAASCSNANPSGGEASGGSGPVGPTIPIPSAATPSAAARRLVIIVMENRNFDRIIGDACCPYINSLAARGVLFTNWYGIRYPSLPNYLAMTGGSTFGRASDATSPLVAGDNLFTQLTGAGISWRAYQESMPSPCFRGSSGYSAGGTYALKHDPAMMFAQVSNGTQCDDVVPFTRFDPNRLPAFSFVTPNMCNDMHDCSSGAGDSWLGSHVPSMLAAGATVLVTWDTGDPSRERGGGRVATILAGPGIGRARVAATLDHYSILASVEAAFGLPRLRAARSAPVVPL